MWQWRQNSAIVAALVGGIFVLVAAFIPVFFMDDDPRPSTDPTSAEHGALDGERYSPVTLEELRTISSDDSVSGFDRQKFHRGMVGRVVVWRAEFRDAEEGDDGVVRVSMVSGSLPLGDYRVPLFPLVLCYFDEKHLPQIFQLKKWQGVVFSGTVLRSARGTVSLEECHLLEIGK